MLTKPKGSSPVVGASVASAVQRRLESGNSIICCGVTWPDTP